MVKGAVVEEMEEAVDAVANVMVAVVVEEAIRLLSESIRPTTRITFLTVR